jgi:hypothetical protein
MDGKQSNGPRAVQERATAVDDFMARLDHPLKAEIEAVRAIIRGVDPRIQESVKWNAPSFSIAEHFATFKLRPLETVQVVFHTGAKGKATVTPIVIDDPDELLRWAAPDRCLIAFSDLQDVASKQPALIAIVQQWIAQL